MRRVAVAGKSGPDLYTHKQSPEERRDPPHTHTHTQDVKSVRVCDRYKICYRTPNLRPKGAYRPPAAQAHKVGDGGGCQARKEMVGRVDCRTHAQVMYAVVGNE